MGHTSDRRPSGRITVVHTSDLHLGGNFHGHTGVATLRSVLDAAPEANAELIILAGDTFDSHRAGAGVIDVVGPLLGSSTVPVFILPGNHDPATPDAIFHQLDHGAASNVYIAGVNCRPPLTFDDLDLEVWGAAHTAYADMSPLANVPARRRRWHIVVAHGHWIRGPEDHHRGWLISDEDIEATGADYIALGHWDVPQQAGRGSVPAWYSGSPEVARTVNLVRLSEDGVDIARHPLRMS